MCKNITVSELFKTFDDQRIRDLFAEGLQTNNSLLAFSALEELRKRGATDFITESLNMAFMCGWFTQGTVFTTTLINNLMRLGRDENPFLRAYGRALKDGKFISPEEWLKSGKPSRKRGDFDAMLEDLHLEQNEMR